MLALAAVVLLFGAFQLGVIKDYQLATADGPSSIDKDTRARTTTATRRRSPIGSGGLVGAGYLNGTQTNLDFVPEQHTDFIFTVGGEEFGFVGAAVHARCCSRVLMWRAIRIAFLSKDAFGTYLAAGIAAMFAIQMFVNIGMVIGIMPITGIPLPFRQLRRELDAARTSSRWGCC